MKKLFLTVLLGVLLTGAAVGQTIPGSWSGGVGQINQVKSRKKQSFIML